MTGQDSFKKIFPKRDVIDTIVYRTFLDEFPKTEKEALGIGRQGFDKVLLGYGWIDGGQKPLKTFSESYSRIEENGSKCIEWSAELVDLENL